MMTASVSQIYILINVDERFLSPCRQLEKFY